jgi:hypothetical protein
MTQHVEGVSFVYHIFGPSETIGAIIKKYNSHSMDRQVLSDLLELYNIMNGFTLPHPGDRVMIPLEYIDHCNA